MLSLSAMTLPLPDQKVIADIQQKSFDANGRINIIARELVEILKAPAAIVVIQGRLIALFRRERHRYIRSGQGWHLPLDTLSRARACGVNIMAQTLGMVVSALETPEEVKAQKALKVVRPLFGIPISKEAIIVDQNSPSRATIFSPQRRLSQPVRGSDPSSIATRNGQSPTRRYSRDGGIPAVNTKRISVIPPTSVKESRPDGLHLAIPDKSPLEELAHTLVPPYPTAASSSGKPGPTEETSIKVCDTASQSHTPVIHESCKETPAAIVRVSEESTGAATEATSIFATRGSQSTDSQDSLLPGLKPLLGKRAGCLPVVREENQSKVESKRLSLHAHGSRLANRLASAFSMSSPALLSLSLSSLPATPIDGPQPEFPGAVAGEAVDVGLVGKGARDGQDDARGDYKNHDSSSPVTRQPNGGICSGPADLDSAYYDSLGSSFTQSMRPTTVIARPALSYIVPMFNQDSTIRPGMSPGQVEINLLRMIEAERQKCIVNGTVWNHRQIDGLTWLITDVQNLVSSESEIQSMRYLLSFVPFHFSRSMIANWIAFFKGCFPRCAIMVPVRSLLNDQWRASFRPLLKPPAKHSLLRVTTRFPFHQSQTARGMKAPVKIRLCRGRPIRR